MKALKLTLAGTFLVLLGYGIAGTSNIDSETGAPVHGKGNAPAGTPVHPVADTGGDAESKYSASADGYNLDVWEDGSGVLYKGDKEIHEFDSDFFPWDCTANGNAVCGANAPDEVRGPKCVTWVYKTTAMHYCTDGDLDTWIATDSDAEGETIG